MGLITKISPQHLPNADIEKRGTELSQNRQYSSPSLQPFTASDRVQFAYVYSILKINTKVGPVTFRYLNPSLALVLDIQMGPTVLLSQCIRGTVWFCVNFSVLWILQGMQQCYYSEHWEVLLWMGAGRTPTGTCHVQCGCMVLQHLVLCTSVVHIYSQEITGVSLL